MQRTWLKRSIKLETERLCSARTETCPRKMTLRSFSVARPSPSRRVLARSRRSLVVHSSDLPNGRGYAPLSWQIIEGRHEIPTCLLDANEAVDAGDVILRDKLVFAGVELYPELRHAQGRMICELCLRFLEAAEEPFGQPQDGRVTTYRRRTPRDSEIDPHKAIADQFDLLRTVDNENFPAFFSFRGRSYKLAITPLAESPADKTRDKP